VIFSFGLKWLTMRLIMRGRTVVLCKPTYQIRIILICKLAYGDKENRKDCNGQALVEPQERERREGRNELMRKT
jgi:hypothetical protein